MSYLSRPIIALLFSTLFFSGLAAQNSFQKNFQDTVFNAANVLLAVPGAGYLLAGGSEATQTSNIPPAYIPARPWLLMADSNGNVLWRQTYPTPFDADLRNVIPANDGGFLAIGQMASFEEGPYENVLLVKTDENGTLQWSRVLNVPFSGNSVRAVPDGYILTGTAQSAPGLLMRITNNGEIVWSMQYGESGSLTFFDDIAVVGDTIYAVGFFKNGRSFFTLSAQDGSLYATRQFADSINYGRLLRLYPTVDGHLVAMGHAAVAGQIGVDAVSWLKITKEGNVLIARVFYLENQGLSLPDLTATSDGGFVLGGHRSTSTPGAVRSVLAKITATAELQAAVQYSLVSVETTHRGPRTAQLPDGGFLVARRSGLFKQLLLTRTRPDLTVDGCCASSLPLKVADLLIETRELSLMASNFQQFSEPLSVSTILRPYGGFAYCPSQPVLRADTLAFCPGDSILVGAVWYNQPGMLTDTLLNPAGCDTITTYTLQWLSQPSLMKRIEFCSGDSVVVSGIPYFQPDTIVTTLPATVGCDTVATYVLAFTTPPQPPVLNIQCPASITVVAATGDQSAIVAYTAPTAVGNCPCGTVDLTLLQGLPGGGIFPLGPTQVCYRAADDCGSSASCCFTVTVEATPEDNACDIKNTACVRFEILVISQNAAGAKTYRLRLTNTCASPLVYAIFQLPNGIAADFPLNGSTYTAPGGHPYIVRNANASPFYSIRFKSDGNGPANGQSDVFEYTLPPQAAPAFIHAAVRLESGLLYETHLNVFDCTVQAAASQPVGDRVLSGELEGTSLSVFPNPFAGQLNVVFDLAESADACIVLTDLTGRMIFSEQRALASAGRQKISWTTENLADGIYVLGLNISGQAWTYHKVVLFR